MSDLGVRIVRAQAHYSASRFHEDGVDLNLSHAEFADLIDAVKADAWEEGYWAGDGDSRTVDGSTEDNPYRKQEEA